MSLSKMSEFPVALVTGASRGIGRAIAVALAREHYRVVVNYCGSREAAEQVVAEIVSAGGDALALQADVGSSGDRQRLIEETVAWGNRLDVLVNNAGITSPGRLDLLEATEENWDRVLATNLKGPFFLSQMAARQMLAQPTLSPPAAGTSPRGTIVNISSISSYAVSTNRADYCVAKAGLQMVTWLFADRLAPEEIYVFEISPGVIESDMTAPVREKYDQRIADGLTPIRRWGQPTDVAETVCSLVAGALPFCTGQRFNVDGGFHIRRL
jgi:NAD(P)-dependent dehydrogenase (short-subunit alcohol dehydrogenase family)